MDTHSSYHGLQCLTDPSFLQFREQALSRRLPETQAVEHTDKQPALQFDERFLQALWNEQRFAADLVTTDGRRIEVVSSGTWNVEAGPDFKDAVLRIDGRVHCGAVEIHKSESDWRNHGHTGDPLYSNVVLHVVWQASHSGQSSSEALPCLALAGVLDPHWRTLVDELHRDVYPYARQVKPGGCAVRWALADDERLVRLLRIAGLARLGDKSLRFRRAFIAVGPAQAVYEGIFEALGYKANRTAFLHLARAVPLSTLQSIADPLACEAALFGTAGLLPDPSVVTVSTGCRPRLQTLWDAWWRLGLGARELEWSATGLRPLNSRERRLAAGVAVLAQADFAPDAWLVGAARESSSPRDFLCRVDTALSVRSPWDAFQNFRIALPRPAALLGRHRRRDLVINVVLPFLAAYGEKQGEDALVELAREAYVRVPRLQPNRLFVEAVHRFLVPPSRAGSLLRGACQQQGLFEIYRSFCLALRNDCKNCPFVHTLPVEEPGEGAYSVRSA